MSAMKVVYRDGMWEVHNGTTVVVRFTSSTDAADYKAAYEARRKFWRRNRKVA